MGIKRGRGGEGGRRLSWESPNNPREEGGLRLEGEEGKGELGRGLIEKG